ncbi:MAG: helicase, partial [Deltaproteobacteria bacterium]|nr:helicase [Deltaproteobacteria bacterium]
VFHPHDVADFRPDWQLFQPVVLRGDLEGLAFEEKTLLLVERLIAFLRREKVQVRMADQGFLHAKCWLFYADRPGQQALFDRFRPVTAIAGSSNFTAPGLTSNRELNVSHKVLLDESEGTDAEAARAVQWLSDTRTRERVADLGRRLIKSEVGARAIIDLERWYTRQWREARDFKQDLINLLDASKIGGVEYTPFQVYMKALYEYFKEDLEEGAIPAATRSAVELAEFQEDAVRKARKILLRHHGVMVADSVGLGKTWIGKKLLEDYAYHQRMKAIVVCPASLRDLWERELTSASIPARVLSQEELGRETFAVEEWGDTDVVLIDESHNFRNRNAQRYLNLEQVLAASGGRGRAGERKKVILLTATPINNDLFDLHNQIALMTIGDRGHFVGCGIGDLYRYFLQARRDSRSGGISAVFNLLEEVVIRRTRPFIRRAYPEATIRGERIHFPERKLRTVRYDLERTYAGIYADVVTGVESLNLAPYNLEAYKKAGVARDELEVGREQALVGIFRSRYLKRFESSVQAFRISVRRALEFLRTFESYLLEGKLLRSSDFRRALAYLSTEDEEDDAMPVSRADEIDASEEAQGVLAEMEQVKTADYDLRRIHDALEHDKDVLTRIWERVKDIGPKEDAKLAMLKELLCGELRDKKVIVFTYFKDTARYLYRQLGHPESKEASAFQRRFGPGHIRRMDSSADPEERSRLVREFSPKSNGREELAGSEKEIQVLLSTDVLSEGQNLQDCGYLLNYDLHWNPMRMVQRAGRIDRIGSPFDTLWIYNMFPDAGLERLLHVVENLSEKIAGIDRLGLHDASILGEAVNPRNFNTLRRIERQDGSVIDEEEARSELASSELLAQQLRILLEAGGRQMLEDLPDGIHSGLLRRKAKGAFFYFRTRDGISPRRHLWRYVDLVEERVTDNRHAIAGLIACEEGTPRVVDPDLRGQVFDLQKRVVDDIVQGDRDQASLDSAPRPLDPVQQQASVQVQAHMNDPGVDRDRAVAALRLLGRPMVGAAVKRLRKFLKAFENQRDVAQLLDGVLALTSTTAGPTPGTGLAANAIKSEDLHLVCFEFVASG